MDKNKIIEAAAKLVAKGAYDKAIKEYQKVLDADPKDARVLQKMGELFQKKNDNVQAAQYFTRVAESYTTDGFFLKAVALYKQVLKLDPSLIEINLKLAELHQQLQLLSEAMGYFQIVANHYDKLGDTRNSLDVLRKMVDLDPDNVASRVKLADLYVREGLNGDAVAEFSKAAEHLKRNGRTDDHLRVVERISALEPDNLPLAKELAEVYLKKGDQKRALAKLQICFKADNRDIETLRLLAVAFQGLGQMSKTISVYKELARAYEDKNQIKEANQTWAQVAQLDPADPDVVARQPAPAASRSAPRPAAHAPAAHRAPEAQAAPVSSPKPKGDNLGKLLTETDVYVKYGLHDKALEHLRKVFAIDPENIDAHEKAYAIYVASHNLPQSFEQLLNVLRLHTRSGDAARAQPYLATILQENPGHPEVPVFLSALRLSGDAKGPAAVEPEAEDAILVESSDDEVILADEPDEIVSSEMPMVGDEAFTTAVTGDELLQSAADVEGDYHGNIEAPPVPDYEADEQVFSTIESDGPAGVYDLGAEGAEGELATGEFSLVDEPALDDDRVEYRADDPPVGGGHWATDPNGTPLGFEDEETPGIVTRVTARPEPQVLAEAELPAAQDDASTFSTQESLEPSPEEAAAGEECDEASFFIDQGLYDEAREILETVLIAYPENRRAAELLARVDAEQNGGAVEAPSQDAPVEDEARDAFDLAAELANELGELGSEPAGSGEAMGIAATGSGEYQVSVEEVFAEFKKGLEKVVKPEDVETHYDLGVAYKEMGLVDDAIGEFSIARKGCLGKRKEIDCLSMIGMLQLSRGDMTGAIDAYQQALMSEHARDEVEKSLRYELAGAYELAGESGKALGQYLKVSALDDAYREVVSKVEMLSAIAAPEDDVAAPRASGPRGGGSRKVGYV